VQNGIPGRSALTCPLYSQAPKPSDDSNTTDVNAFIKCKITLKCRGSVIERTAIKISILFISFKIEYAKLN